MGYKVLMLGEALDRQGGIVSVEKLIIQNLSPDIPLEFLPTLTDGAAIRKLFFFLIAIAKLFWILIFKDIDIVHIHISERGSAFRQSITTLIATSFGKPVVIHTHGCNFHIFFENLSEAAQNWLRWTFSKCSQFITLSDSWKSYYVQNLRLEPKKVVVMLNPVQLPDLAYKQSSDNHLNLLFLGRIGKRKGAYDLVQAFSIFAQGQKTCARLTLAGDGEGNEIRALIKNLQLSDSVDVLDWVDQAEKDSLLSKTDIFLLPSYNEGLPMALIEAMSWALPVITTPVGGIPELVSHNQNGLLIEPGNIQQLSVAIGDLTKDKDLRLKLGKQARESTKHLDIKMYLKSLIKVYSCALLN